MRWFELLFPITHRLDRIEHLIKEGFRKMADKFDDLITQFDTATTAVADRIDKLIAAITAQGGAPTEAQLASFQAISDRLKSLGADPSDPIPPVPPQP